MSEVGTAPEIVKGKSPYDIELEYMERVEAARERARDHSTKSILDSLISNSRDRLWRIDGILHTKWISLPERRNRYRTIARFFTKENLPHDHPGFESANCY